MRRTLYGWRLRLLGWLQRQCSHPPELVSYDIAEGRFDVPISWCRICGATRIGQWDWREPRADWWITEGLRSGMSRDGRGVAQL